MFNSSPIVVVPFWYSLTSVAIVTLSPFLNHRVGPRTSDMQNLQLWDRRYPYDQWTYTQGDHM
jgi:hypothetical protein